jgi:hypothetical protein
MARAWFSGASFSLDTILASTTTLGITWIFGQAYLEGSDPLRGQVPAKDCSGRGDKRLMLYVELCRRLESDGYVVIDNFLTKEQVELGVATLADDGLFVQSPNERVGNDVRTDKIYFFGGEQAKNEQEQAVGSAGLSDIRDMLSRLGYDIAASPFRGFPRDAYHSSWLGVPDMMQISVYNRQGHDGGYYRMHKDSCDDSFQELGLLGYLRSRYLQRRYLTCIVYLNPEWEPSHGGCLRIVQKDGKEIEVEPKAGRLVIFSSVQIMHAVMPTFSRRLACSMWMTLNE